LFHGRDDLWPIGLATRWQSKDDGLYGTWQLNDSPNAQRAAAMAKSGELGFLSIGFVDVRSVPELAGDYNPMLGEDHMDRITRIEARLVETSIVPTPAYADAQVTLVRDYRRPPGPDRQPRLKAYRDVWNRDRAAFRMDGITSFPDRTG
jgi:HK97 family phage prohead protease